MDGLPLKITNRYSLTAPESVARSPRARTINSLQKNYSSCISSVNIYLLLFIKKRKCFSPNEANKTVWFVFSLK